MPQRYQQYQSGCSATTTMGHQYVLIVAIAAHLCAVPSQARHFKRGIFQVGDGYVFAVQPTYDQYSAFSDSEQSGSYPASDFKQGLNAQQKPQTVATVRDSYGKEYKIGLHNPGAQGRNTNRYNPGQQQQIITLSPELSSKVLEKYIHVQNPALLNNYNLPRGRQQQQQQQIRPPLYKIVPTGKYQPNPEIITYQTQAPSPLPPKRINFYAPPPQQNYPRYEEDNLQYQQPPKKAISPVSITQLRPASSMAPMDEITHQFDAVEPQLAQPAQPQFPASIAPNVQQTFEAFSQEINRPKTVNIPKQTERINVADEEEFTGDDFFNPEHFQREYKNRPQYYLDDEDQIEDDAPQNTHYDEDKFLSAIRDGEREQSYIEEYENVKNEAEKENDKGPKEYTRHYYNDPPKKTKTYDSGKYKHTKHAQKKPSKTTSSKLIHPSKHAKDSHYDHKPHPPKFSLESSTQTYMVDGDIIDNREHPKFVKPKYHYGFEPIITGKPKKSAPIEDSEGKYSSNHPTSVKKIYKENWYISKVSDE